MRRDWTSPLFKINWKKENHIKLHTLEAKTKIITATDF